MKAVLVLLFLCGCALASTPKTKIADQQFLERQKNILRLFFYINQPNTFQDQVKIGNNWNIQANLNLYNNQDLVKRFLQEYNSSYLPKGEIFSVAQPTQVLQAKTLFEVFYNAIDFDTFYKTACWARQHINEGMFVYVLSIAVIHRPDCEGIILPSPYEIYPHYFVNSEVIQKVYKYHMQDYHLHKNVNNMVVIPANYSGWYVNLDPEQQLTYFLEDVGLNSWYYYYNLDYPGWLNGSETGINRDRRGELYYFVHQQILARYNLERLSNGLPEVPLPNYHSIQGLSYIPSLIYPNGLYFPFRPANAELIFDDLSKKLIDEIYTLEVRLRNAIDSGYVLTKSGDRVRITNENGINILGNLIQGNPDSLHQILYGYLPLFLRKLYSYNGLPKHYYKAQPGVLEHFETSLRDPAFYSIYRKIIDLFQRFKVHQGAYTYDQLIHQGVTIENVEIDKLITYFDTYDFDLNNILYSNYEKELDVQSQVVIKARQQRLNHKPFTYRINVNSEKNIRSLVQTFIGPKYDLQGNPIPIELARLNFFLIDRFIYELKSGKNVIERNSRQSRFSVKDRTSYLTLYQRVLLGLQGSEEFPLDNSEAHCGFPNRLILPKGSRGGSTFQLYVVISPIIGEVQQTYETGYTCGIGSGQRFVDSLPFGYPFDRPIIPSVFKKIPNIYSQDIVITHRTEEEINSSVQY